MMKNFLNEKKISFSIGKIWPDKNTKGGVERFI
jgi:hypothetical protein